MKTNSIREYDIDYVEIYTPMAKVLAYWHVHALGFTLTAYANLDTGRPDIASYVLTSNELKIVLTTAFSTRNSHANIEVASFIQQNHFGVKRCALKVSSVGEAFENSIANGAIPLKFPAVTENDLGYVEEAAIKLYDNSELVFSNRAFYQGAFKPGYKAWPNDKKQQKPFFVNIDHLASEVRINESSYWTNYLIHAIGLEMVQSISRNEENKTGMIMNINQSPDKKLTLVIAEPESYLTKSKVQQNIDAYGAGIHHIAFTTHDLVDTVEELLRRDVEFVSFPSSYYDLLRANEAFDDVDIDALQRNGVLIDKEGSSYLLQKFIKPISDRPFFLYEVIQRVNGYEGFALKNINMLKKAEEVEIMRTTPR